MAEINIKADKFCSNLEAVLAVAQWMADNKAHGYKRIRNVEIENSIIGKKEFNVFEKIRKDELESCNADFIVTSRNRL